ncbi:MAG TPA: cell envelope integrity protein CreD [Vicinamibacteria bacterium]|nr:cell envelope integrity protein CreD [Vicinamibacteria bacterium]
MLENIERTRSHGQSPVLKAILVAVLIGLLLLPLGMVMALIHEREATRNEAEREVSEKWGTQQTVGGPVLVIPYLSRAVDANGKNQIITAHATLLPRSLEIQGELTPEFRYRGIFEVPLYTVELRVSGSFAPGELSELSIPETELVWKDAVLSVGIPDPRGIRQTVKLHWDEKELDFEPGSGTGSVFPFGIHVGIGEFLASETDTRRAHPFQFELALNGSRHLAFVPVGQDTRIRLASSWPSPSFTGAFLPDSRSVTAEGFSAEWRLFYLGRSYPQRWRAGEVDPGAVQASAAGVDLVLPVDAYLKSMRSAKYGILFLVVTFGAYFLFEILGRSRIHPFQYLLVGAALVVFYVLLLSLSEHVGFDLAYGLATLAILGLILGYSSFILGRAERLLGLGALLSGLYVFLYVVLQLEDLALLLGSIGLFLALGAVMWITRRVDWYALQEELENKPLP